MRALKHTSLAEVVMGVGELWSIKLENEVEDPEGHFDVQRPGTREPGKGCHPGGDKVLSPGPRCWKRRWREGSEPRSWGGRIWKAESGI